MENAKTPEQLAEETRLKKEAEKAAKAEAKALADAQKLAEKTAKKEADEKAKAEKAAAKAEEKRLADIAKAEAKAANTMPESNGIRRPKPGTACGNAWAIYDALSGETQAPATMAASLERGLAAGLNEATLRTQYARWRKFFGIVGRLADPKAEAEKAAKHAAKEAEKLEKKQAAERKREEAAAKKEADKLAKAEAKALEDANKVKTDAE